MKLWVIFLLIFAFLHVVIFFTIKHILLEKAPFDLGFSGVLLNNTLKAHTLCKSMADSCQYMTKTTTTL